MVDRPLVGGVSEDTWRPAAVSLSRRQLTQRECDVLIGVANGLSDKEIAVRLFVSKSTVKTHLKILYRRFHLRNRAQAAVLAYTTGLLNPEQHVDGFPRGSDSNGRRSAAETADLARLK